MGTTKEKMQAAIKSRLGSTGRTVELQNEDYENAVNAALKVMARYRPERGFTTFPISASVQKYHLDVPNLVNVADLTFFHNGPRFTAYPYPDSDFDHTLIMGQMKTQEKYYGDLPQWQFHFDTDPDDQDKEKGYIYMYFNSDSFLDRTGRIPTHAAVEYLWHLEYSDDKKVGLPRLRRDWQDWAERYATAEARIILGTIRDKFKGIPGPAAGMSLGIDGADLIKRGETERDTLEADIRERQVQIPIIID